MGVAVALGLSENRSTICLDLRYLALSGLLGNHQGDAGGEAVQEVLLRHEPASGVGDCSSAPAAEFNLRPEDAHAL